MRLMSSRILGLVAAMAGLAAAIPAGAQGTITFTAETTSGDGSVVPALSWSTQPAATACTASGDWTGAKGASGAETLPAATSSRTYNLTCTWADTQASLTWVAPTANTDGSPYTDPAGYRITYNTTNSTAGGTQIPIPSPATTNYVIDNLTAGTWYFWVQAINSRGVLSDLSNGATKTLGTSSTSRSVGITVNPKPGAPINLTVQ